MVLANLLETLSRAASSSWTCEQTLRLSWGYHPFCSGQEATVQPLTDSTLPWAHFLLISCFPDTMKLLLILQLFPAQIGAGLFSATSAILSLKNHFSALPRACSPHCQHVTAAADVQGKYLEQQHWVRPR